MAGPGAGAAVTHAAADAAGPAGVQAPYADLANAGTGADLWNRAPSTEVPMGSIVKVMTAYVVIQSGNLDQLNTVPSGITGYDKPYGASTAGLKPGVSCRAAGNGALPRVRNTAPRARRGSPPCTACRG